MSDADLTTIAAALHAFTPKGQEEANKALERIRQRLDEQEQERERLLTRCGYCPSCGPAVDRERRGP